MKQIYKALKFQARSLALIERLDAIATEYMAQDLVLSVRQLYYQMVARAFVENTERSYGRIAALVNDARLAGLIDWDSIEDRTREFKKQPRWDSPSEILRAVSRQYHEDLWAGQPNRVFVIVEKEALAGVLGGVCRKFDVPLLAARGYPSGTVLREFALEDLRAAIRAGQQPVILHLGDHDPSGLDMSRDLEERLALFAGEGADVRLDRIALNWDQIHELNPPPNPAKETDVRFAEYRRKFGDESWELDALSPAHLLDLVTTHVEALIEKPGLWEKRHKKIATERAKLVTVAEAWS
jgi:hypothetical protein